jgi:hypothetical protein
MNIKPLTDAEKQANAVGPHEFRGFRWYDYLSRMGRCVACYLPKFGHPVHCYVPARPIGDAQPAEWKWEHLHPSQPPQEGTER